MCLSCILLLLFCRWQCLRLLPKCSLYVAVNIAQGPTLSVEVVPAVEAKLGRTFLGDGVVEAVLSRYHDRGVKIEARLKNQLLIDLLPLSVLRVLYEPAHQHLPLNPGRRHFSPGCANAHGGAALHQQHMVLGHLDLFTLLVPAVVEVAPLKAEVTQAEVELLGLVHSVGEGQAHPLLMGGMGWEREEGKAEEQGQDRFGGECFCGLRFVKQHVCRLQVGIMAQIIMKFCHSNILITFFINYQVSLTD
ncbi:hypothetical protein FGO68_gene14110 [Halteria grandinella]|uniref:Secreted protein n=1 Tax=Halteria grandinella TaxID=5974 RepID=A0A8J8T335_HALGN|nr:hypothetical protein FGO68_gene14110 [Halteria grandinella]